MTPESRALCAVESGGGDQTQGCLEDALGQGPRTAASTEDRAAVPLPGASSPLRFADTRSLGPETVHSLSAHPAPPGGDKPLSRPLPFQGSSLSASSSQGAFLLEKSRGEEGERQGVPFRETDSRKRRGK